MLQKALAEVEASRVAIKALQSETAAWQKVAEAYTAKDAANERLITALERQNDALRAIKCNETKFLFGVIKTKRCY
jgi:hypothetical protein